MNKYDERNVSHQRLNVATANFTTGGTGLSVVSAPGSGKRLRVYAFSLEQRGTSDADVTLRFGSSGLTFFKQTIPTGGSPVVVSLGSHFVEGDDNEGVTADLTDQTADDLNVTIYYTTEDI